MSVRDGLLNGVAGGHGVPFTVNAHGEPCPYGGKFSA